MMKLCMNPISVNLLTDTFQTSSLFTSGMANEATSNMSRDEFLAHTQLRINDALNRKAVSADEATVAASTLSKYKIICKNCRFSYVFYSH